MKSRLLSRQFWIIAMAVLLVTGCDKSTPSKGVSKALKTSTPGVAVIYADPNPVPAGAGSGTTTIYYDTGDGSLGEVYMSTEGAEEQLFTKGRKGSEQAPWITAGRTYEFRLYQVPDRSKPRARVKVTRNTR